MNSTVPRLSRSLATCLAAALVLCMLFLALTATDLESKTTEAAPGPALSTLP